jgi:hypothetical protein
MKFVYNNVLQNVLHNVPCYGRLINNSSILGKFGVPRPVTGSHPFMALKPSELHPGFDPTVTS